MKILVVEDEIKLAKSLKQGLEQSGYAADYLLDGESGQQRIELHHENYDAIILDVMLPKRDGISVCKNIRSHGIVIPVLMLTARDTADDTVLGLDAGADDYLIKPFSFDVLTARLRALLRRPTQSLPTELKIKDIVLDTATRKVYQNNRELKLTLKELMLLEYFMRHHDQVLSREQLLNHAWDFSFDSFSNVIDVHVKNLRKKLDEHSIQKHIETVRGLGYRFWA